MSRARSTAGIVGFTTVALSACGDLGAPQSATEQGDSFTSTWRVFFIGAVAVALMIWVLVFVAVLRFRRRSDEIPNQKQYNIPFELSYTALPLVIVIGLFALTLYAENRFTALADEPDVRVEVTGFQWGWQFHYVDEDVTLTSGPDVGPMLVLPVGETVRLRLATRDVNHSFWVPEFLEKRDLIQQVDNEIDVEVTEPGEWIGRCAEYCGLDHWKMRFDVRAVDGDDFATWLDDARQQPQPIIATDRSVPSATRQSESGS